MFDTIRTKLPIIFSAYASALLIYFMFIYSIKLDYFVWVNLLLLSLWSAYAWVVVWKQSMIITDLLEAMNDIRGTVDKILLDAIDEIEEEIRLEEEEKKRKKKSSKSKTN